MVFKDYYKVLGVYLASTELEIKTAYRKLSKKFHPDVNDGDSYFEERFKEIQEAFEILGNPSKRTEYDLIYLIKTTEEKKSYKSNSTNKKSWEEVYEEAKPNVRTHKYRSSRKTSTSSILGFISLIVIIGFVIRSISSGSTLPTSKLANQSILADTGLLSIKTDSVAIAVRDSSQIVKPENTDSFAGILLRMNTELVPFNQFPKDLDTSFEAKADKYYMDLDKDGIPEIITRYWSGGAHCCNLNDIFVKESDSIYKDIFHFTGDLKISGNNLYCNFYETIGYFMSCYSCSIEDSLPSKNDPAFIHFFYSNGKVITFPFDQKLDNDILTDLKFLSKRPVPPLNDLNFDDGTRKAYASRILSHIFNTGSMEKGKELFYEFYSNDDKDTVWNNISEDLDFILNKDLRVD